MVEEEKKEKDDGEEKEEDPEDLEMEADYKDRANVKILEAEDDEAEIALKEYREKMAALLPTAGQNFTGIFAQQNELDKGFEAFYGEEYDDDKIGGLDEEEIEPENLVKQKVIEDAVDEFIEEKKQRFPDHYKEFGTGLENEEGKILRAKNAQVPREDELEEDPEKAQ